MNSEIPQELQKVFDYIDAHQQDAVDDLVKLVQQPSVSAQNLGMEECADLVVSIIHKDGLNGQKYHSDMIHHHGCSRDIFHLIACKSAFQSLFLPGPCQPRLYFTTFPSEMTNENGHPAESFCRMPYISLN